MQEATGVSRRNCPGKRQNLEGLLTGWPKCRNRRQDKRGGAQEAAQGCRAAACAMSSSTGTGRTEHRLVLDSAAKAFKASCQIQAISLPLRNARDAPRLFKKPCLALAAANPGMTGLRWRGCQSAR